jgi:hypothetical protein
MEAKDARIYISSVNKITKRLQNYGDAKLENISLLRLIYKYACYSSTYSQLQRLDKMVSHLQKVDPNICMEKQAALNSVYTAPLGTVIVGVENIAPTLVGVSFTVVDETYVLYRSEILAGYSDTEGTEASLLVVKTLPANGTLFYNGTEVVAGQVIELSSILMSLVYSRNANTGYSTSFTYSVYDGDTQLPLESNTVSASVTVDAIVADNEAPTVGDRTIYSENRATTVFTSADFTSLAVAAYSDPEGDLLDAIIVRGISNSNAGIYYFFGSVLTIGQIITKAELDTGALYHVAPDSNAIATDSFSVAIRDTGSMIWVE